jgi:hypothetical protein
MNVFQTPFLTSAATMNKRILSIATFIALTPLAVYAQMSHGNHGGNAGHGAATTSSAAAAAPSTKAYEAANEQMHQAMSPPQQLIED